jgi:hypothetical protein
MTAEETQSQAKSFDSVPEGMHAEPGTTTIEMTEALRNAQHVEFRPMGVPLLPPKQP